MDWDFLIPILFFAFPVAVAILDKRIKKRRQESSAQPRPPFPSANRPWSPYPPAANTTATEEILRQAQDDSSRNDERTNEGQRAIARERHQEVAADKKDPEPKLRIDKKNLILYSEILKPKFDA